MHCYRLCISSILPTVYPKKYAHGFVVLCFVVVMQSFIMNSHEVFIHIHQGCFADTEAIVRLPQCQWSKPAGYGKISQCITTTKHSKAKTVCIFLGIYCIEPDINSTYAISEHIRQQRDGCPVSLKFVQHTFRLLFMHHSSFIGYHNIATIVLFRPHAIEYTSLLTVSMMMFLLDESQSPSWPFAQLTHHTNMNAMIAVKDRSSELNLMDNEMGTF